MTRTSHQIAQEFIAALSRGLLPTELLTEDMTAWTTTGGVPWPRDHYIGGVAMLGSLFPDGLHYTIQSLTAENDRVIAEAEASGILTNGESFQNRYVFVIRICEGKITSVAEHFNPDPVRRQIAPLIQAILAKANS